MVEKKVAVQRGYEPDTRREGFISAFLQVLAVLIVVSGAVYMYAMDSLEKDRIAKLILDAKRIQKGDDAVSLLKAKKMLLETKHVEDNTHALVYMAEITARLFNEYGMKDTMRADAEHYITLAKNKGLRKPERYTAEAYFLLGDGDVAGAERVIKELTDHGVRHPKLLHALSLVKMAQGQPKEAYKAAEEGAKLASAVIRLPIAQTEALLAQGKWTPAKSTLMTAWNLNKDHLMIRSLLLLIDVKSRNGKTKMLKKRNTAILTDANDVFEGKAPPRVTSFVNYLDAEIAFMDADLNAAMKFADKALEIDPKLHQAAFLRGRLLIASGETEKAIEAFKKTMELTPNSLVYAQKAYEMLKMNGQDKAGIELIAAVEKLNPDLGAAHLTLAKAQAEAGDLENAKKNVAFALEKLGNADPEVIFAEGLLLQAGKKYDEARVKYQEAIKESKNPNWPEIYLAVGQILLAEKSYEQAAQTFEKCVTIWERAKADVFTIANAYQHWAKAVSQMKGKKNKALAEKYRKKADDLLGKK